MLCCVPRKVSSEYDIAAVTAKSKGTGVSDSEVPSHKQLDTDEQIMAKTLRACVLVGSAREGRLADRVLAFVSNQLKSRGWEIDVLDPLEMDLPILRKPIFFYEDMSKAPPVLLSALGKIKSADAFVVITCEYNHCLPPGLTNLIDHFPPPAYAQRPSSIICYSPGIYGGMRAAMQARALLGEINTVSIPNIFGMPEVQKTLDAEGNALADVMNKGAEKHFTELEWYAKALKTQRESSQ